MNLEQMLNNLNNLNLSEPVIDNEVLENITTEDIDTNIDEPNVVVSQIDLIRVMNLTSSIIQSKSDNVVYNSITFISNNTLRAFATNELSHFTFDFNVLNNSLKLVFSIPLVILQKLTKLMAKKVMFFVRDSKLYIRLLSGDLLLDMRVPDIKILKLPIPDNINECESVELPINAFGRVVSAIYPILNTEIRTDARKISFLGERAFYMSPFYYVESSINTPNISLRMKDAEFISKLYKFYKDKNIIMTLIQSKLNRILIRIENISYVFISGTAEMSQLAQDTIDRILKPIEIIVNFDRFDKLVNLATLLPNSTGDIKLSIEENELVIKLLSSSGESRFTIPYELINPISTNKTINLHAEPLKKLLVSFAGTSKIGISFSDFGVILEKDGVKAILMHNDDI